MRNLWIYISKHNAVILFFIFFASSFLLLINNNSFQRASSWNSSNEWVASQYQKIQNLKDYLRLKAINDSLAAENGRLLNLVPQKDSSETKGLTKVVDTASHQQYSYYTAKVINNSVRQKNNYITIDKGSLQGIKKGMGVLGPNGVVGIVLNVSPKFATIQSLLHSETRISASLASNRAFGSLVWGAGNFNSAYAVLQDIPNHIKVKIGEKVVTSGYSLFPAGIPIGTVSQTGMKGGDNFLNIEVKLATNFATLSYVHVVNNDFGAEQKALELSNKTE
jgi:rod shape-determining protein MreC